MYALPPCMHYHHVCITTMFALLQSAYMPSNQGHGIAADCTLLPPTLSGSSVQPASRKCDGTRHVMRHV